MKVTIICDNTSARSDLGVKWGFSALVEAHGRVVLFDTGGTEDLFVSNMNRLGVDPGLVQDVFISHPHWDHTGGLSAFLHLNPKVTLWMPSPLPEANLAARAVLVKEPRKLYDGLYSTGKLQGIEQSLCVETNKGLVVVVGCSHPDMGTILETASQFGHVYGVIGGMHGNRPESLKDVAWICPVHCTQHKEAMRALYPERYVEGGAGRILEIE